MGNTSSRTKTTAQRQSPEPEQHWAHSFPRNQPRISHLKVLPNREADKKLRPTNNGEILHSGGTISGRHYQQTLSLERDDKSFSAYKTTTTLDEYRNEHKFQNRTFIPHIKVNRYAGGGQRYENKGMHKERMKKFESEPDLRDPALHYNETEKSKAKKKYKAPPPPRKSPPPEKSKLNSYRWDEDLNETNEPITRRARLFKTKAEVAKKYSSPVTTNKSLDCDKTLDCRIPEKNTYDSNDNFDNSDVELKDVDYRYNSRFSLPEMHNPKAGSDFQTELKEVLQRIKCTKPDNLNSRPIDANNLEKGVKTKLKTLDHNIVKNREKQLESQALKNSSNTLENENELNIGKPTPKILQMHKKRPSRLFYFGMNEPFVENVIIDNAVDRFAATLQPYSQAFPLLNSSGSDISSELEMDESQVSSNAFALQLRPILPKKQLEIPRFSPAAAWKLLYTTDSNLVSSSAASDDVPIILEERIEKLSRPPPPPAVQTGPRSSYDKSGDSGISGDAGPAGFEDNQDNVQLPLVLDRSPGASWTPQQDLGEDESSTDDEMQNSKTQIHRSITTVKFTPKPNVFSLSLPRDNQLSLYIGNKTNGQSYVDFHRLKESVSAVLGNLGSKRELIQSNSFKDKSENWFLSKSAPNSLNNGFSSLEMQNSVQSDQSQPSNNLVGRNTNSQNVSRVMYLPELDKLYIKKQVAHRRQDKSRKEDLYKGRSRSAERTSENYKVFPTSKSCENIASQAQSSPEPEDLQDPPKQQDEKFKVYKPKRFTFQSTIRQIERRRLAEKLSREAERKERQRLSELEAMQKVEEEFQKKRAREKASIRQQLRLFSLEDITWSSLPPNLDVKDDIPGNSELDGAVSSSSSSTLPSDKIKLTVKEIGKHKIISSDSSEENYKKTPMTCVLSEYKQEQREYRDFRGSPRYRGEYGGEYIKHTTVHPQVTYKMPKASEHQNEVEETSNYRKQFAHGVKSNRSGEIAYI